MTLTAAVLLFAVSQKSPPPKQIIVFGEDTIEVDLKHPDGEIYLGVKHPKFGNLIKVRDNFSDKIVKSVEQM